MKNRFASFFRSIAERFRTPPGMRIFGRIGPGVSAAALSILLSCDLLAQGGGTWTTKAPMLTPRARLAVGVVDGTLYAVGGERTADTFNTVEAYDPRTDSWSLRAPMQQPRALAGLGVVEGILYVLGGISRDGPRERTLNSMEAYDPKTNTWSSKAPMPTERSGVAVGVVDGILYAVGGLSSSGIIGTLEAYDPKTNTWESKAPMPTPREQLAVASAGGCFYAIGGARGTAGRVAAVEAYDAKTDTWTTQPSMPTPRAALGTAVIDGTVYAVGGFSSTSAVATVEAYDPKTNSWSTLPPIKRPRWGLAAGVVADVMYAVGGGDVMRTFFSLNEAFSPFLMVGIDVKPGDATNTINLKSAGTVPVAILGSATFDPLTVDPATVTLAGAPVATRGQGTPMTAQGDFNHDGYLDLLLHFRTQGLQLTPASTEAVLYGTTFSGQRIRGSDSVRIVSFQQRGRAAREQSPGSRN